MWIIKRTNGINHQIMNNKVARYIFHCLCYYCAWLSTIYFAKHNNPWGGPITIAIITLIQVIALYKKTPKPIIQFTATLTIIGFLIDSTFSYMHLITLMANPFYPLSAPWMIGLWINFGIIFYDCSHQYFKYYFPLLALSLFGFPLAYFTGSALGAAKISNPSQTLTILGLVWAIILPTICYYFYKRSINETNIH